MQTRTISLALVSVMACGIGGTPDPRELEGAIAYLAVAIERDDPSMLFRAVDARARHAMISIVADRQRAAEIIRVDYPEDQRAAALAELGDAATVEDATALFALRCDTACRHELSQQLGAPTEQRVEGDELVVTTVRGGTLRFHKPSGTDAWYGWVWETDALDAERDHANRDLRQIEQNAETYRRRRALEE